MNKKIVDNKVPETTFESKTINRNQRIELSQEIHFKNLSSLLQDCRLNPPLRNKVLILSLFVVLFFICFLSFFYFVVPLIIKIIATQLGLNHWIAAIVFLACTSRFAIFDNFNTYVYALERLDVPIYVFYSQRGQNMGSFYPVWWLKNPKLRQISINPTTVSVSKRYPQDIDNFKSIKYLKINIVGGLIPLLVAGWQFSRVPWQSIVITTAIATIMNYFLVQVVFNRGVYIKNHWLWSIVLLITTFAIVLGTKDSVGAIAYAGVTIGTFCGADLLHIRDLKPYEAQCNYSIGGAGWRDGIVASGLYALLLVEIISQIFLG